LLALTDDESEHRRLARQFHLVSLDLTTDYQRHVDRELLEHPWAEYVADCLGKGQIAALVAHLMRPRPGLTLADLAKPELPLETSPHHEYRGLRKPDSHGIASLAHAHGPHPRHSSSTGHDTAVATRPAGPATSVAIDPAAVALLEELDDAIYDAIALKPDALSHVATLWPRALGQLDSALVEESRERYLAYAMSVWNAFVSENAHPERAIAALDVIDVLGG
jgi:hypothetical protein